MLKGTENSVKKMLDSLEHDVDFLTLIQKYESPNCFSIMGNKRREEWHSNFVNWLLDPKGNHKLGKFPLEKFLSLVESKKEDIKFSKTDIENMVFQTELHIPYVGRIDILGSSDSLIIVIENKIKAKENFIKGEAQTNSYFRYCEEKYKDKQRCYIHLKAFSNSKVDNKNFISVTYQELFDSVIKPACEKCDYLGMIDTKKVLEQYAIDISNPFLYKFTMAHTEEEIAKAIYQKHEKIINIIRQTMNNIDRNKESAICKFYKKYKLYINNIILKSLGKDIIRPKTRDKLEGKDLIEVLLDKGYIIPNETELIYFRLGGTCVIKINEDSMCYAGFYNELNYDGSQDVEAIGNGKLFETIKDAAKAVEKEAGSESTNPGISPYNCIICNAGIKEAEGKTIREILCID